MEIYVLTIQAPINVEHKSLLLTSETAAWPKNAGK